MALLRSMSSGISGLEDMQVAMDAISNNISNVNTTAYKAQRVSFQTQINQLLLDASSPGLGRGGTNPEQVGLGVSIASIDTDESQGALQTTGINTDLAITGNGYFVLNDGQNQYYTRDGGFGFDSAGDMVKLSNGMKVQGWTATGSPPTINTSAAVGNINIPSTTALQPSGTANISIGGNLDANTPTGAAPPTGVPLAAPAPANVFSQSVTWHDSLGNSHQGNIVWAHTAPGTWQAFFSTSDPTVTGYASPPGATAPYAPPNLVALSGSITFNANGIISANTLAGMTLGYNTGAANTNMALNVGTVGSSTGLTQFADGTAANPISSAVETNEDGFASGRLGSFAIDNTGIITGIFTNGQSRELGQVAMANFNNPQGLTNITGQNIYQISNNSGTPQIGPAQTGTLGSIQSGALEGSNVDLAKSFADMINIERGFQANSKSITTSDQMIQELLTLKQ